MASVVSVKKVDIKHSYYKEPNHFLYNTLSKPVTPKKYLMLIFKFSLIKSISNVTSPTNYFILIRKKISLKYLKAFSSSKN